LKYREIYPRL